MASSTLQHDVWWWWWCTHEWKNQNTPCAMSFITHCRLHSLALRLSCTFRVLICAMCVAPICWFICFYFIFLYFVHARFKCTACVYAICQLGNRIQWLTGGELNLSVSLFPSHSKLGTNRKSVCSVLVCVVSTASAKWFERETAQGIHRERTLTVWR